MNTSFKLIIAACVVVGVTAYMAYVGTATSWKYYLTVDECLADAPTLARQRMRVSGKVAAGSLAIATGGTRATFKLRGTDCELPVDCAGPLPDNLAEEMDVVVEGRLEETGRLQGDKVLTRCASKYAPEEKTASVVRPQTTVEGGRQ